MTAFTKYTLFQIPGWIIAGLLLAGLMLWLGLVLGIALGLFVLWVIKDFALYPLFRESYELQPRTGSERLIGEAATTTEWLRPEGYVKVQGQLWRAVADPEIEPIAPNTVVWIKAADGLTLRVTANEPNYLQTS